MLFVFAISLFLVKKDYENGYNYREKLFEENNSVIFYLFLNETVNISN
jgi:hypothetical protein